MNLTTVLSRIIGPVLLLRSLSILIDRQHFIEMLSGLEREVMTISFSFFPIALLMGCIALVLVHADTSNLAGILIRLIAWGGIFKASILILFPSLAAAKAQMLGRAGFLDAVLLVTFVVGGYFTWFGYFESSPSDRSGPGRAAGR